MYDPIAERLELFESLAQHCLVNGVLSNVVEAVYEPEEALAEADFVIIQLDLDSAAKFTSMDPSSEFLVSEALEKMLATLHPDSDVLSLLGDSVELPLDRYQVLNWPPEPDEEYRRAMPHQVLRWVRREDSIGPYLDLYERSPLKQWLEDPSSLPVVNRVR